MSNGIRILSIGILFVLLASGFASGTIKANSTTTSKGPISILGTTSFPTTAPLASSLAVQSGPEVPPQLSNFDSASTIHTSTSSNHAFTLPTQAPSPETNKVSTNKPGLSNSFNGLDHADTRLAGTGKYAGTQYSLEPPDQALCVGNGFVIEGTNDVLRAFSTSGATLSTAVAISQFFNLGPEVNRVTLQTGSFPTDPRCYFDASTARWFITVLNIPNGPLSTQTPGRAFLDIAVSEGSNPIKSSWILYSLDVTDDGNGGTPSDPGCPCLGDQPLIGADANGFYISTNEFPVPPTPGFNGAQIYAMSKLDLEKEIIPTVVHINAASYLESVPFGGPSYSVQPAEVPAGGSYAKNAEYFLSALQFCPCPGANTFYDDRIALWTLSGTNTLTWDNPKVSLHVAVLKSEVYGAPPPAQQKAGPTPLGTSVGESLELLNTNDDRMNQVVYANGLLWSGLNTAVMQGTTLRAGIAFFVVDPTADHHTGQVVHQGYVSVKGADVFFPSIGVNTKGDAVMTFSLSGPKYFPSSAYTVLTDNGKPVHGSVNIAGAGALPEDGFTGYATFGSPTPGIARWGDYSAAVADSSGNIWLASEYIPSLPRTALANWGTFVMEVDI